MPLENSLHDGLLYTISTLIEANRFSSLVNSSNLYNSPEYEDQHGRPHSYGYTDGYHHKAKVWGCCVPSTEYRRKSGQRVASKEPHPQHGSYGEHQPKCNHDGVNAFQVLGILETFPVEREESAVENCCSMTQPPNQQLKNQIVEQGS